MNPGPVIKPARRGSSLSYKNKTLLSTMDPVGQAERAAAAALEAAGSLGRILYFCPSPLLGYGLGKILASLHTGQALLCVETDPVLFDLARSSIDPSFFDNPRFALTNFTGPQLCRFVRDTWGARAFRRLETVKLSGGWQLDTGYERSAELLRRDIALAWGNAMTLVKLGRRFTLNAIRNTALLARVRPITDVSFGARPVLVLGAGPSLDPLLDFLQGEGLFDPPLSRDSSAGPVRPFVCVCVDTCLAALRERGIVPDLAVILESQFWNLRDFTGFRNAGTAAALDLSAWPPSAGILGGASYFFFTPWTSLKLFERLKTILPPPLPPLGSVGLTAVELALRLGSGPVLTAGIDFSFTLDGLHARSSPAHLASLVKLNRFRSPLNADVVFREGVFAALSKGGLPVKSDPAMRTYRAMFEDEFSGESRIRDIEGSGLALGLKTLTFRETAALLAETGSAKSGGTGTAGGVAVPAIAGNSAGSLLRYIRPEIELLEELRETLTGKRQMEPARLEDLLDRADYLWAHFPDCAGTGGIRPPASDTGFLKRIRAELDPFIKSWKLAEKELNRAVQGQPQATS